MSVMIIKHGISPDAPSVILEGEVDENSYTTTGSTVDAAIEDWVRIDELYLQESLPEFVDVYELVLKETKVRV